MRDKLQKGPACRQAGFTLIEILIAITIIGVIAAAVLVALDPLDQIRKTQDTNSKSAATEYLGALQLYYANRGIMPWEVAGITNCPPPAIGSTNVLTSYSGCTTELINSGQLKSTVAQSNVLSKLYIVRKSDSTVQLCFNPESKAESKNPSTTYDSNGNVGTCNPSTTDCYICLQ